MPLAPWIPERLRKLGLQNDGSGPHYEASYYGPIDKMANVIFSGENYMVKLQAKLRKTAVPAPQIENPGVPVFDDYEEETNSLDSFNASVITNEGPLEPDFLIVRVDKDGVVGNTSGDQIVACIEVKRSFDLLETAERQINNYLKILAEKEPHRAFRGILVMGPVTYSYTVKKRVGSPDGQGRPTHNHLEEVLRRIQTEVEREIRRR